MHNAHLKTTKWKSYHREKKWKLAQEWQLAAHAAIQLDVSSPASWVKICLCWSIMMIMMMIITMTWWWWWSWWWQRRTLNMAKLKTTCTSSPIENTPNPELATTSTSTWQSTWILCLYFENNWRTTYLSPILVSFWNIGQPSKLPHLGPFQLQRLCITCDIRSVICSTWWWTRPWSRL